MVYAWVIQGLGENVKTEDIKRPKKRKTSENPKPMERQAHL